VRLPVSPDSLTAVAVVVEQLGFMVTTASAVVAGARVEVLTASGEPMDVDVVGVDDAFAYLVATDPPSEGFASWDHPVEGSVLTILAERTMFVHLRRRGRRGAGARRRCGRGRTGRRHRRRPRGAVHADGRRPPRAADRVGRGAPRGTGDDDVHRRRGHDGRRPRSHGRCVVHGDRHRVDQWRSRRVVDCGGARVERPRHHTAGVQHTAVSTTTTSVAPSTTAATAATEPQAWMGVRLGGVQGAHPLAVTAVDTASPAQQAGIVIGDQIVAVDGTAVTSADQSRRSSVRADRATRSPWSWRRPPPEEPPSAARHVGTRTVTVVLGTRGSTV
jgi:hypothetical protein